MDTADDLDGSPPARGARHPDVHHAEFAAPSALKYIFVTGGVVSSLGKGLAAASIGALLEGRGFKVTLQKFDPYINVDPGTMCPTSTARSS